MATINKTDRKLLKSISVQDLGMLWPLLLVWEHTPISSSAYAQTFPVAGEVQSTNVDNSTRQFIKLEKSFLQQAEKDAENFPDARSRFLAQEKMRISTDLLLNCTPEVITLQLTNEGAAFYTIRKKNIDIYLEHSLIDHFDGQDEAIVSVYKDNNTKILDFAGSLAETITQLNQALAPESIALPELA